MISPLSHSLSPLSVPLSHSLPRTSSVAQARSPSISRSLSLCVRLSAFSPLTFTFTLLLLLLPLLLLLILLLLLLTPQQAGEQADNARTLQSALNCTPPPRPLRPPPPSASFLPAADVTEG